MKINGVRVDDTFAEAFPMVATRLLITAHNIEWAHHAARAATGFATSVIACGCEAGVERELKAAETPDERPGVSIMLFSMALKELAKQVRNRVSQCVLTSPTSACFSGMDEGEEIPLGKDLRFFGDGYQSSKQLGGTRYWRVPVMDGEFICEENARARQAIGGGNFLVLGKDQQTTLNACEKAIKAMRKIAGVVMPFPGGVVRSGSKVGSIYKALTASTNEAFCPTLRGQVKSELSGDVGAVMEIVVDGLDEHAIWRALKAGIQAACSLGPAKGVYRISAGNYGGKLGPHHFHLRDVMR